MKQTSNNVDSGPGMTGWKGKGWGWLVVLVAVVLGGYGWFSGRHAMAEDIKVYKSPSCSCCGQWIAHLKENGFTVAVQNVEDMDAKKQELGVPEAMASCHTAVVGPYLVEGHVPAQDIKRMLAEKPAVRGIAVPGMPTGSPGMESPGSAPEPYSVLSFGPKGPIGEFARH
jgi:hypothetical protein